MKNKNGMSLFFLLEVNGQRHAFPLSPTDPPQRELALGPEMKFRLETGSFRSREQVRLTRLSGDEKTVPVFAALRFRFNDWNRRNYLLMPGAVYNGNRIIAVDNRYNASIPPELMTLNPPPFGGNISHLSAAGGGRLEQLSGEYAYPGAGIWNRAAKRADWLLTAQGNEAGNYSFTVEESELGNWLEVTVSAPAHRLWRQRNCIRLVAPDAPYPLARGESITFEFMRFDRPCASLREFFRQAFDNRNRMVPAGVLPD